MTRSERILHALATGVCALFFCLAAHAQARDFNIPGGTLKSSLDAYVQQSGVQLIYRSDDLTGLISKGVKGASTPEDALSALLDGTPLKVRRDGANAVVVFRPPDGAFADSAAAVASAPPKLDSVVITGSRLKSPDLVSDSPLVTVNAKEIQAQGTTNIENLLNNLPQVTASQSSSQSTFGTPGTATLNLRNLGPERTLVLIDGRRLMPGDPIYPYADVNFIPASLVSSIDVVTGGASAVYGSDAVAGVVNFRMKRDLEGFRLDMQGNWAQHRNDNASAQSALTSFGVPVPGNQLGGATRSATLLAGFNTPDGKGNATLYGSYSHANPVTDGSRDWAACGLGTVSSANGINDTHVCQGSSNSAFGRFRTNGSGTGLANNPNGTATFVPYNSATMGFNSNTLTYLQRQDERASAGAFAHYEVSSALDLYADLMFMRDRTKVQISPSGLTSGHIYSINCDNPLLSAQEASALCGANAGSTAATWNGTIGYRLSDGGLPRYDDLVHNDARYLFGAKGALTARWNYDVSAQYSTVKYSERFNNDFSISRIQNALLVKNVNSVPTCTAAISGSDPNCVPLNIFQLGRSVPALGPLYEASHKDGLVQQKVVTAALTGDLGAWGAKSPWAVNPVGLVLGAEWRKDSIDLQYSDNLVSGDLSGTGTSSKPASGSISVNELFGEASLPLIENRPGIKNLSVSTGYRWSDYSSSGSNSTYKLNLKYAPVDDVSFRAGYNRAVRAPNVVELFSPVVEGTASGNDPCAGTKPTVSLAKCQNSGVTAAQYGTIADCPSGFCRSLTGGNTALKPETSDTYTLGFVLTPQSVKALSLTVDYFDIKVKDKIGVVPASLILAECLNNNSSYYCGLIHRNAGGSIASEGGYTIGNNQNTGLQHVSGIDIGASYRLDLATVMLAKAGAVNTSFIGTWLGRQENQSAPGQALYRCEGLYGAVCGVPNPQWRHKLRVTWDSPWNTAVSLNWRFIGHSALDSNTGNATLAGTSGGVINNIDGRIPSYSYYDLGVNVAVLRNVNLRFGINNLFDKDPPILGSSATAGIVNGNTYSGLYDTLGRVFYAGLSIDF